MGKSTNGPDWTDVATFLSALDSLHGGKTGILLTTTGQGRNGSMHISIVTSIGVVPGSEVPSDIITESEWPCKECGSLMQHLYGGLYKHDFAIGLAYQQRFLPEMQ